MFIRVKNKSTQQKYKKSVQIVHSFREKGKVKQKIVKHIGVATSDTHLEELKLLAQSIQIQLENEDLSLFTPEELQELDGRGMIVRKLKPLPVEAIVRGYLVGSGWKEYQQTQSVCGIPLPKNLKLAEKLPEALFTPSTKAAQGDHDENISFDQLVEIIGKERSEKVRDISLALYQYAADFALQRGIIIAGVLAAAMSTLSSSINALSSSTVMDWMQQKGSLLLARWISGFWAVVLITVAMVIDESDEAVVMVGDSMEGYLSHGDVGIYYPTSSFIGSGKYVINTSDGLEVRSIARLITGELSLSSNNANYPTETVPK